MNTPAFIHGAYVSAWCWDEHFLPWFARRGWQAYAVSLSGHGRSRQREHLDSYSIDDYVRDVAEVAAACLRRRCWSATRWAGWWCRIISSNTTRPPRC